MLAPLKDWGYWWADTLRQLFGMRTDRTGDDQNSFTFQADGLLLSIRGKEQQIEKIEDVVPLLIGGKPHVGGNQKLLKIKFDPNGAVIRKLTAATLPESRHTAAARLDMQASTPFKPADFHRFNLKLKNGNNGTFYAIIKREPLSTLLDLLKKANLKLSAIEFDDRGQRYLLTQSALNRLNQPRNNILNHSAAAVLAVCALMLPVTFANYVYRYNQAIDQVQSSIEPLMADAKALRLEMDKRAARIAELQTLRNSIEERKPAIAIWEELARVLPDTSFLTDMTVTQDKVSIAGYSKSATELIVALEGSNIFDEATFTAPVVKVPGQTDDHFSIDLMIGTK